MTKITPFKPVTIVLNTPSKLASLLGALIAYGQGKPFAENGLKAIGLGDYYNGNVRASAREFATAIVDAVDETNPGLGLIPPPDFAAYLDNNYNGGRKSLAGAAVRGTSEDIGGSTATSFEEPFTGNSAYEEEVEEAVIEL